jgi:hypothetical protein
MCPLTALGSRWASRASRPGLASISASGARHSYASARVPDAIIEQVRPYLGVRGDEAVEILRHRPLNMSREDASTLTECIRSDILDDLVRRYDAASDRPFRYLPQQAQTIIASVAFQFGTDLKTATPRFWRQVVARDWKAAHANLLNFGCAYRTRRRKEAAYLADLIG